MNTTYADYLIIARDTNKATERVARQPQIAREVDYYLSKIGKVKTADEFVADRRLMSVALTAFGIGDMVYAKAFVRKLLAEGTDAPDAFANRLADQRYLEFARTFDFKRYGDATTAFGATQKGVADKYIRQNLESQAGSTNEGVRLALYFERHAPALESVTSILADKAMITVVRTMLGLPETFSLYGIDKQISILEKRLNVEDLKSPDMLKKHVERFAALWDAGRSTTQTSLVASLFANSSSNGLADSSLAILTNARTRK
jgi:Protein of unknown function (DUF1217)